MQPSSFTQLASIGILFQYPLSDRGWCNIPPEHLPTALAHCFSILYRIVGGATEKGPKPGMVQYPFQYPLSDREWCTFVTGTCLNPDTFGFSILYRIVGGATTKEASTWTGEAEFQYPLSDRGWCNGPQPDPPTERGYVSVSSIGSWVVQPGVRHYDNQS